MKTTVYVSNVSTANDFMGFVLVFLDMLPFCTFCILFQLRFFCSNSPFFCDICHFQKVEPCPLFFVIL